MRTNWRTMWWGLVLGFLSLAVVSPALASYTVVTGKHTYHVDVRNSNFRDVWGAWVTVNESGDHSATVHVRADGYKDAQGWVSISPNQNSVYVQVRLEDPTVRVDVTNRAGQLQSGFWVDQNQFMAQADEYRLEVRPPAEGFTKFSSSDVRVDFAFGTWVNVWGSGANRRVEIRIPRRSLGSSWYVNLRVRIASDAELATQAIAAARPVTRQQKFDQLYGND